MRPSQPWGRKPSWSISADDMTQTDRQANEAKSKIVHQLDHDVMGSWDRKRWQIKIRSDCSSVVVCGLRIRIMSSSCW
jgi:hypothetical protein